MKNKHIFLVCIIVASFVWTASLVAMNYNQLPDQIPTHYGVSGDPDSWGSKTTLLIYPSLQVAFLAISLVIYKYPNYANIPLTIGLKHLSKNLRERAYEIVRDVVFITMAIVTFLMLYLTRETLEVAKGQAMSINLWGVLAFLIFLAPVIVYYSIKMRRLS
ncbi:hypothetical protein AKJ47_02205 [candidate division MSBL1 archaeon SCGC-AAA261G05]|uniref:DUF1648 domain-containing protein n=2 Tax=candidate division MSBL1 TaxID=215777 RepID=A0A133VAJ2_9EURY|nr:hypothetical protein AKJ47_02205 [candidate division MSBL1 archaeon SCGC-AAA261G05]KXB05061.1 hypothetical protein AKJ48_00330 [candidate division MSBL1 archaeon SCGC-AAA261O19]